MIGMQLQSACILIGLGTLFAFINLVAEHSFSLGIVGHQKNQEQDKSESAQEL